MFNTTIRRAIGIVLAAVILFTASTLCSPVHAEAPQYHVVSPPPPEEVERLELSEFYAKYVSAGGSRSSVLKRSLTMRSSRRPG